MGWTGIFDAIRKSNGTIDRKATLERDFSGWSNGESITKMLKGSMAGSVFYAAMETTTPAGREVWALVILTSTNGAEFCYKDMDETCGPCEASCPVSILDALTPTTNETANAWRQRCRENLEKKKAAAGRIPRNATQLYITFLRDTTASRAGESVMVYKIDGAWIYTSKTGGRWRLTAALLRNDEFIRINGTEEPTPAPLPEESTPATSPEVLPESNQDTTTGAQDGPTTPESNTAGENTTGADKAPEKATTRPKRRTAYIVECRSPRGSWTAYSAEQSTHEAAEKIKEEAESRNTRTPDGAPIFYRIVQIDKGPEQIMTPQEGPTTAGRNAAGETPTTAETAPQDATTGPETSTATQDTTGSDTRPPRATEDATTGHAAGDTSTPANQEPGTAAKSRNNATPCDNTRHHATPGHACEIAPGRKERRKAEHVPIAAAKSPPRAKTRDGRRTSRASTKTAKRYFFRRNVKKDSHLPVNFRGTHFLSKFLKKSIRNFQKFFKNKKVRGFCRSCNFWENFSIRKEGK